MSTDPKLVRRSFLGWIAGLGATVVASAFPRASEAATRESQGESQTVPPATWVNVKTFGALGNNVADDTAAIRRAIASALSTKRYFVYLPAGDYRISGPLTLGDVVSLVGDGLDATVIRHRGASSAITLTGTAKAQVAKTNIRDLSIFGDGVNSETGLALSFAPYGAYQNLRIYGFRTGVSVDNSWCLSFAQVTAESSRQDGWNFGRDANNVGMKNCVGLKNVRAGFYVSGARALVLLDCDAEENGTGVVIAAAPGLDTEKVSIIGGYYESNTDAEVSVRSDGGGTRPKAVTIRDAYFVHAAGGSGAAALRVRDVSTLAIEGCAFSSRGKGYKYSLRLEDSGTASGVVWGVGNMDDSSAGRFKGAGMNYGVASQSTG